MKILALDTAASWCAAAIYDSETDQVLAHVSENIGKGHAEVLMDYVERALANSRVTMREIDRVAVNIGPGSFTGVRIGVSAARGFALALDCPAVGITAFAALATEAAEAYPGKPVLVLLDAHRGEIYAQAFDAAGAATGEPVVLSRDEALSLCAQQPEDSVLAGSAGVAINEVLGGKFIVSGTEPTGQIATYARLAASSVPGDAPKPLYMRGPDVKPQTGFALPHKSEDEDHAEGAQ